MAIKLFVSDMDGTFLDERGSYDKAAFAEILDQLADCQAHFVVATGNSMSRLSVMFDGFMDRLDFIAENGALVTAKGKLIAEEFISKEDVKGFLAYFQDELTDYRVMITGRRATYVLKSVNLNFDEGMITPKEAKAMVSSMVRLDDFSQLPTDEQIVKMVMMASPDMADGLAQNFNQEFSGNLVATPSGFGGIDFIKSGIHKGWGLEQLMAHYQLTSDQVMAFGDSGNDRELLQLVEQSYAMENASTEIKAVANYLAPSHRDNGVLRTIKAYLDKEIDQ